MTGNCKCNVKNWLFNGVVVGVLYLGLDMFFHNYCLQKIYQDNFQFFRPLDSMMTLRWWGYLGYLLFGLLFSCIFSQGYEAAKGKMIQGLRFGLLIGLFFWGSHLLLSYPYMPWPNSLYFGWFAIGVFEFALLGLILGLVHKPTAA